MRSNSRLSVFLGHLRRPSATARSLSTSATAGHGKGGDDDGDRRKPVCLVLGGGAGVGQAVGRKFSQEGFHCCVVRRGSGPNRLMEGDGDMAGYIKSLEDAGGSGQALFADCTKPSEVAELVKMIETDVGPIHCAVYNIGAQVGNRPLEKTSYRIFDLALSMGAGGLFALAKEVSPYMIERGHGTIIATSATAGTGIYRMRVWARMLGLSAAGASLHALTEIDVFYRAIPRTTSLFVLRNSTLPARLAPTFRPVQPANKRTKKHIAAIRCSTRTRRRWGRGRTCARA